MPPECRPLRVAHISDLHVARSPKWGELNLKRLLGHVNSSLFRRRRYQEQVTREAVRKLASGQPDVTLLTGDITQLGLAAEFDAAESILSPLADAGVPVVAVAGNHDIYGERPRRLFEEFRRRAALGLRRDEDGIIRLPGVEILPLEQGIASPPFFSYGRQGSGELERAAAVWRREPEGVARIVCGHYPVIDPHGGRLLFLHGLRDAAILIAFCRERRVSAYFCGHNHRRFSAVMPGGCVQYSAPALSDRRWRKFEQASIYECRPGEIKPVRTT